MQDTYRSVGPGATLEHLSSISPGIPVFRAVAKHIAWQHHGVSSRGRHHKSPNKAKDVELEMRIAVEEKWFQQTNGRRLRLADDRAKDVVTLGLSNLSQKGAFECWWDARSFKRSRGEEWMSDALH
jgi:hypothetical protein